MSYEADGNFSATFIESSCVMLDGGRAKRPSEAQQVIVIPMDVAHSRLCGVTRKTEQENLGQLQKHAAKYNSRLEAQRMWH